MEAIILGTAAAEGIPALFCGCEACRHARAAGGKNIRARQSLFLPPDIMIDFGPDSMYAVHRFGLDLSGLAAILYSHSHADHCIPQELEYVRPVFSHNRTADGLDIYGNEAVVRQIPAVLDGTDSLRLHIAAPFQAIRLPNATATPISSYHMRNGENTLNYLVSRGGKTLLCAWDTGHYDEETWEFLKGVHLDGLIIECTYGTMRRGSPLDGHMDLPSVVEIRDRLLAQGSLANDAPAIITHFSHNGILPHEEFDALAHEHGLSVAYDGMHVTI